MSALLRSAFTGLLLEPKRAMELTVLPIFKGLVLVAVASVAACGRPVISGSYRAEGDQDGAAMNGDLLLGTWRYSGSIPDLVVITLTVRSDKTFSFDEDIAPATMPVLPQGASAAGAGCRSSFSFSATYAAVESGSESLLTWEFQQGVRNVTSGCNDPTRDRPGIPLTRDVLDSYISEGIVFSETITYAATASSLVINPKVTGKAGLMGPITFARVQQ